MGSDLIVEARALTARLKLISVSNSKNFAPGVQWYPEFNHDKDASVQPFSAPLEDACRPSQK